MKKLIFILLAIILLFGCEKKGKIEIIENYDIQYYSEKDVARPAFPKDSTLAKKLNENIVKLIESEKIKGLFPYWRLYINKSGNIVFIKDLGRKHFNKAYSKKEIAFSKSIIEKLLPQMAQWEFTPAIIFDENVKSYIDIRGAFAYLPNGTLKVLTPIKFNKKGNDFANYYVVAKERMPEPIGGIKAIQSKIVYPELAKRAGIEGRVYVKAYVDSTGTVAKTELIRGIGGGCDEVAIEAVKKVKFIPGMQDGKRMNVQVTVPILFKLQ